MPHSWQMAFGRSDGRGTCHLGACLNKTVWAPPSHFFVFLQGGDSIRVPQGGSLSGRQHDAGQTILHRVSVFCLQKVYISLYENRALSAKIKWEADLGEVCGENSPHMNHSSLIWYTEYILRTPEWLHKISSNYSGCLNETACILCPWTLVGRKMENQ